MPDWGPRLDPIAQAISDAQADEDNLDILIDLLKPKLRKIAQRIASQCVEDALQEACIRIWKKIQMPDLSRPSTAKSYIMTVAVSGMRDTVRKWLREHKHSVGSLTSDIEVTDPSIEIPEERIVFPGILEHYLEYVEETGTMKDAHKHVAKKLRISTAWACTLFHKESKKFIQAYKVEQSEDRIQKTRRVGCKSV